MILINGKTFLNGTIDMPLYGAWNAVLTIDDTNTLAVDFVYGAEVQIVDDNGLTFKGNVVAGRGGSLVETTHVRVSGKGGLPKASTPKQFQNAFVRDIVNSLMNDAGMKLNSNIDNSLLSQQVGEYSIVKDSVANCLGSFLEFLDPNINWRVKADGTIWFGLDNFPNQDVSFEVQLDGTLPSDAKFMLGVDSLSFEPGVTLKDVGKVSRIQYQIETKTMRAQVLTDDVNQLPRGVLSQIQRMIENEVRDRLRYTGLHVGGVKAQSADWTTVDISPLEDTMPSMSNVKIISGHYELIKGESCLFGWADANPKRPFAIPFQSASLSADFVALSSKVDDNLSSIQTAYNAHVHLVSGSATGAPDGYTYTASATAAERIKAK